MISMAEKIVRLGIKGCEERLESLKRELRLHKQEFLECGYALEFEKEWFNSVIIE